MVNCTFSGNSTTDADGAGIYNWGPLTVSNSTFFRNSAGRSGGGILNEQQLLLVTNSTFSDNRAANANGKDNGNNGGGGISNAGGTLTVINSTFSSNSTVLNGGGIASAGRPSVITNSTFSGNTAGASGASVFNSGSSLSINNTIMAANAANCSAVLTDAGYNISTDSSCGFSKTGSSNNGDNVNPLLSTAGLQNNGGPTKTIALQSASPAIDTIPVANCTDQASPPNPIITDQRGFPRPDGEGACDIGAYEHQDSAFVPFARFGGQMRIDADAGTFFQGGGFVLKSGSTIDPTTQPVAFSVGSYAIRIPAGSFVKNSQGYVYQNTVDGITLYMNIKFTSTSGTYQLNTQRHGGTLSASSSPIPVTLIIGNNGGTAAMFARFY